MHIDRSQKVKICYIKMFILRQEKRINVNAFMVHELKMAESLGPDSARVIEELEQSTYSHFNPAAETLTIFHPPPKTVKKVNKERMRAKVVNCLTPGVSFNLLSIISR